MMNLGHKKMNLRGIPGAFQMHLRFISSGSRMDSRFISGGFQVDSKVIESDSVGQINYTIAKYIFVRQIQFGTGKTSKQARKFQKNGIFRAPGLKSPFSPLLKR